MTWPRGQLPQTRMQGSRLYQIKPIAEGERKMKIRLNKIFHIGISKQTLRIKTVEVMLYSYLRSGFFFQTRSICHKRKTFGLGKRHYNFTLLTSPAFVRHTLSCQLLIAVYQITSSIFKRLQDVCT